MPTPTPIQPPLYVVQVRGVAADGRPVQGTGFVVSAQGHVATCRHVVYDEGSDQPLGQIRVKLPFPAEDFFPYQVAASAPENDLVLLESIAKLTFRVPEPMLHENWKSDTEVGDPVTVWGYSAAEHYIHAQHFKCSISGFSEVHGRIGLDGHVNPGDSGGPVLDAKRQVIGVVQVKDNRREGQAMAIPVSLLRALLREAGVASGKAGANDAVVFQVPKGPEHALVGRDRLLQDLKLELSDRRHVALCFTPGVGKSAVATVLANDREMRAHFQDGVLWASLNRTPNVLSELKKWAVALGLPPEKIEQLEQLAPAAGAASDDARARAIEQWGLALEQHIGDRRMLLVVDDAWELEPAKALLLAGPNCAHVVTTREQARVARRLKNFAVHVLGDLSEADGVALLAQLAPTAVEMFPHDARAVFHAVAGLPQGLLLLGMYLAGESWDGDRERIRDAFREIQERFKECTEPLQRAIRMSYDALPDDETRRALQALSIFRAKPGKFSRDAALAVVDGGARLLYRLQDAGLVEKAGTSSGEGGEALPYTMHRTIAEFARGELSREQAEALHGRAMAHFSGQLKAYEQKAHDPGSYAFQYHYESPQWQDAMDDFLYHLGWSGDPGGAATEFGSIYFNAFWWWGCYADFPFCTRLLQQAATKRLSPEARQAFDLLVAFDAAYPKETQRKPGDDWEGVRDALTRLRHLGGLDGPLRGDESEVVRHTRALTDIFLAEAYRFGRQDATQAERLYRDALELLPPTDWSRPWALYHLADMHLENGRNEQAWSLCTESLALAEAEVLADRDNEVIANVWRVRAESAERMGRHEDALEALQRMVLHAYAFQSIPEPPDAYTVAFYRQITGRAAAILQQLHRSDPARALAYCGALRRYWTSYRELADLDDGAGAPADVAALLSGDRADALCEHLFPRAPSTAEMHQRGSRFFNEVIAICNEKMGIDRAVAPAVAA